MISIKKSKVNIEKKIKKTKISRDYRFDHKTFKCRRERNLPEIEEQNHTNFW